MWRDMLCSNLMLPQLAFSIFSKILKTCLFFWQLFLFVVGELHDIPDSVAGNRELCLYKQQRFRDQFLCIQCNMQRLRRNGSAKNNKKNGSKPQKFWTFAKTSGTVAKERERIQVTIPGTLAAHISVPVPLSSSFLKWRTTTSRLLTESSTGN